MYVKVWKQIEFTNRENNGNKYRLSKETGIDRVLLYRVINGEREPSKAFVDKVYAGLRLSPADEKKLRELYEIAKIGEDVHERRLLVKELVNHLNSLRMEQKRVESRKAIVVDGLGDRLKVVSGSYNVNMLVRDLLEDLAYNARQQWLRTNIPFDYAFLFDILRHLYFEMNGAINIRHIVTFAKDTNSHRNPNINLETLANMLPFLFCEGNGYQPEYYYPDTMNYNSVFMPYSLFTETRLLMLSSDFKTAMLVNDFDAVNACHATFDAFPVKPLFRYLSNPADQLNVYSDIYSLNDIPDVVGIERQPCWMGYLSEVMVETYIRKGTHNRESVKLPLIRDINCAKSTKISSFFIEDGLNEFISNGYLEYESRQYALPIDVSDRLLILKSFREDIARDRNNSRIINPSEITVSQNTTVQIFINSTVLFSTLHENGRKICFFNESSIYESFSDFFLNIHNTDWVYSKQETLDILDKYIRKLEKYTVSQTMTDV